MTVHALERLEERCIGIPPQEALDFIRGNQIGHVGFDVTGKEIREVILPTGQFVYPVIGRDNAVVSVLTEGMDYNSPTGRATLTRSPMPTETIAGVVTQVPRPFEKVEAAGAYRMPMSRYHSQDICLGPSVSSTGIRAAVLQSPRAFWKTFAGNPNRYPDKDDSSSLILGKAAHALILGDEVFDEHFIYLPADAPSRPTVTQVKAFERDGKWSDAAAPGAAFWAEFDKRAAGRLLLKQEQVETIKYMAESLSECPVALEVLKSNLIEISLIWQDPVTGLWLKARPDCIPANGYDFGDLKTFAPKSKDLILSAHRSVTDYGYEMQMALAVMGAEEVFGMTAKECALVFLQTSAPYECIPVKLDEDVLYWGRQRVRKGIDLIAHGLETGDWPGIAQDMTAYRYPDGLMSKLEQMQIDGELPND